MKSLSFQLYYLLAGAWRQRYIILLPVVILPLVGIFIGVTSDKQYKAHTSMLIQETAKMNPFLEDLAVGTMLKDRMAALTTLLHSRHILRSVAEELNLIKSSTGQAEQDVVIAKLSQKLNIMMAGKDLIKIELKSDQQMGMKETLESVSRHFVEQLLAPERSSINDSATFLKQSIDLRLIELEKAENSLATFRNDNAYALPNMHANNLTRLIQLKEQLAEREIVLAGKKRSLGDINQQLSSTNPIIGRIEEQIINTQAELSLFKTRYTEKHSKVLAVSRKLRRLEAERQSLLEMSNQGIQTQQLWDIASNVKTSTDSNQQPLLIRQLESLQTTRSNVQSLLEEINWLKKMISELEPKIATFGEHEYTLQKLERDINVKRNLYEDLLQRYEMALITGSLSKFEENKRVKVIDRPFTPTAPANLPLIMFILGGLVGGIFLGIGLALVFELSDTSIRRIDILEELTKLPVLTRLPSE